MSLNPSNIGFFLVDKLSTCYPENCYLAERFRQTYPPSTQREKRKRRIADESNGDDSMMDMHVISKTQLGQSARVRISVLKKREPAAV